MGIATDGCLWASALLASLLVEVLAVWLCALCLYALLTLSKYMNAIDNYDRGKLLRIMNYLATIGGMVGLLGLVLSFLLWRSNKAYRLRYVICSYVVWGVTMIAVYVVAAACIFSSSDFKETFSPGFSVANYSKDQTIKKSVDAIQTDLKCCGNQNYTEWFGFPVSEMAAPEPNRLAIPESCCDTAAQAVCQSSAPLGAAGSLTPYHDGCLEAVSAKYSKMLKIRAGIMLLTALIEVLVIAIFCMQAAKLLSAKPSRGENVQIPKSSGPIGENYQLLGGGSRNIQPIIAGSQQQIDRNKRLEKPPEPAEKSAFESALRNVTDTGKVSRFQAKSREKSKKKRKRKKSKKKKKRGRSSSRSRSRSAANATSAASAIPVSHALLDIPGGKKKMKKKKSDANVSGSQLSGGITLMVPTMGPTAPYGATPEARAGSTSEVTNRNASGKIDWNTSSVTSMGAAANVTNRNNSEKTSRKTSGTIAGDTSTATSDNASEMISTNTSGVTSWNTSGVKTGNTSALTSGNTSGVTSGNTSGMVTVDTSGVTSTGASGMTTGNTSDLTSGNTSGVTSGDTAGVITGNTSGMTSGNPSGVTSGDTSGLITGNTSGVTTGNTSGEITGNTSGETSGNTSGMNTGNTSGMTSGNTSGVTSKSASGMTTGNTSGVTTGNTSGEITGNTSGETSGNTSGMNTGNTSRMTSGNTSGVTRGNTSGTISGNTSGMTSRKTSGMTTGNTSGVTSKNTSRMITGKTSTATTKKTSDANSRLSSVLSNAATSGMTIGTLSSVSTGVSSGTAASLYTSGIDTSNSSGPHESASRTGANILPPS